MHIHAHSLTHSLAGTHTHIHIQSHDQQAHERIAFNVRAIKMHVWKRTNRLLPHVLLFCLAVLFSSSSSSLGCVWFYCYYLSSLTFGRPLPFLVMPLMHDFLHFWTLLCLCLSCSRSCASIENRLKLCIYDFYCSWATFSHDARLIVAISNR